MASITVGGSAVPGSAPLDNPLVFGGVDNSVWASANVRPIRTDALGILLFQGPAAAGAAITTNPNVIAGSDGTNAQIPLVNAQKQLATTTEGQKVSYSAGIIGYAANIASQTDVFSIIGSASKTIRITRVGITGVATTANVVDIQFVKRSTANTGSTPVVLSAVPHDASDAAASTVVTTYTVTNPTLGTLVGGPIRSRKIGLATAGGTIMPAYNEFLFGKDNDRAIVLRGVAQTFAINFNAVTPPAGTLLNIDITWTEE